MSSINKSLLAIILSGALFTLLLVINHSSPKHDSDSTKLKAQQLSDRLNHNIDAISKGLEKLSNNVYWQNSATSEWSQNLSSQQGIYQAAGLNILGIHAKSSNALYIGANEQIAPTIDLEKPISKLYKTKRAVKSILTYKELPAIIFLQPIRTTANDVIGVLVGIKFINEEVLKEYHIASGIPSVLLKNSLKFHLSIDSSPDLNDFELVYINWPTDTYSSEWQIALLVEKQSSASGTMILLFIGLLITIAAVTFVWLQLRNSQNSIKQLNQMLDLKLPVAEQIKKLTHAQSLSTDVDLLDCAQSIRSRIEQLSQQKKTIGLEVRKLQESQDKLLKDKTHIKQELDSAVAAPRLKSEFLSRMGDEITTPMKSVVSMLKLLSEYSFDAEPKQLLNIAKRSTRTLVNNLNNILDFSKLDAEMLKLSAKKFSVRELVDDLSSELSHFAKEKDLSLQASSDPEIPSFIRADDYRIKQILRNLLGNAIRFTKEGEVTLYADILNKGNNKFLRFTISDTGIGISPAAQKELFDSLQQTTKLSNSSFAGRLRLIVSKHLAELMGGEIGVISEIDKGSQFWFTVSYEES